MASHDDDDIERMASYRNRGVTIHEFPVNLAAAEAGRRMGSHVCVGAPNVVRDGSTGKGMRAREAIDAGAANIICSDYYPPAMLQAVFKLSKEAMTAVPGCVPGISGAGPGCRAGTAGEPGAGPSRGCHRGEPEGRHPGGYRCRGGRSAGLPDQLLQPGKEFDRRGPAVRGGKRHITDRG